MNILFLWEMLIKRYLLYWIIVSALFGIGCSRVTFSSHVDTPISFVGNELGIEKGIYSPTNRDHWHQSRIKKGQMLSAQNGNTKYIESKSFEKDFYFFGLVPRSHMINVDEIAYEMGLTDVFVQRLELKRTFLDWLFLVGSLGFYAPIHGEIQLLGTLKR